MPPNNDPIVATTALFHVWLPATIAFIGTRLNHRGVKSTQFYSIILSQRLT